MSPVHRHTLSLLTTSLLALPCASALAGDMTAQVGGGITAVAQFASDDRVDNEAVMSADLVALIPMGPGELTVYLEGNTTPRAGRVADTLGEANYDAGSALDSDGHGRLQISELHYTLPAAAGSLTLGLLDPTGFLDGAEVANDETAQFLSAGLGNNASIGFPDYTLGMAYNQETEGGMGFTLLLTGSNGLGDNPKASYSELADLGDTGKGVFAAAEVRFGLASLGLTAGVWTSSADHARLNGSPGTENNSGIYGVAQGEVGEGIWSLRLGLADDEVSQAESFVAVAIEHPIGPAAVGAGIAHTGLSDQGKAATEDDTTQAEIYARFDLNDSLHITPSVQFLKNSGFDASDSSYDAEMTIIGLRLGYSF